MPVPKVPLADALHKLRELGPVTLRVESGGAVAELIGPLQPREEGSELILGLGCSCSVRLARERLKHLVLSEKAGVAHVQAFDGAYEKVVSLTFPQGLAGVRALIASMDGNEIEIG